jgi:hypothetical protein
MATTYASADDVANALGFPTGYFTEISTPTTAIIEKYINRAEDKIDLATGHAWRSVTITNEYPRPSSIYRYGTGIRMKLVHRSIVTLDKLEIWDGSDWVDYVATKIEGRNADYWFDPESGIVYILNLFRLWPHGVKVSYTFGETTVPGDIAECATFMAALTILNAPEFNAVLFTQAGETTPMRGDQKRIWIDAINKILSDRAEFQ